MSRNIFKGLFAWKKHANFGEKLIYDFEIIPENTRISHEKAELSKFKICFYNFSQNTSI